MKLTKEWLREAATLSNLYNGDEYYEEVADLKKTNNTYTAIVYGTNVYDVQIEETELDIDCYCTCSYDIGGLCKHIVAVGLNILDNNFEVAEEIETADYEEIVELIDYRLKDGKNYYKNVFEVAEQPLKEQFLQQLFEHNESLRKNFLELISNNKKYNVSIDINSLRKRIFDQLLGIDFSLLPKSTPQGIEADYLSNSTNFYLEEKAIEQIEKILNPYGEQALSFLEKGELTNALMVFLSLFEASFGLPDLDFEGKEIINNFEAEAMNICKNWQQALIELIADTAIDTIQIQQCIDLVFDRWQLHHTNETPSDIYYDFKFFEPFLLAILTPESAPYLKKILNKNQLINFQTAQIGLHTAQLMMEEDWWLEIAENYAGNDPKIAELLLKKYHSLHQTEDFYRIARWAFNLFPDKLSVFLLNHIHPKIDQIFYVELLTYFTKNQQDIEAFKELREYITEEEKEIFIQNNVTAPVFYARLLAIELRFSEILALAKTHQNSWDFNEIVRPIMHIYPHDIFDFFTKRTIESLTIGAKSKDDYKRICKNLQSIQELKGMEVKRVDFIKKLKKQFKNRGAFLEELVLVGF